MRLGWAATAVVCALALSSIPGSAQSGPPRVIVNDSPVSFPVAPRLQHGIVIAPLIPLASAFGAAVVWDRASETATVTSARGLVMRLSVGESEAVIGASRVALPAAPILRESVVFVPAAAVLRALGAYVRAAEGEGLVDAVSQVTGLRWTRSPDGGLVFRIATTGPVGTEAHVLEAPDRLAVDIIHAADLLPKPTLRVGEADVVGVRNGQFHVRPYVTRLVFDLTHPVPYRIAVGAGGVTVTLNEEIPATPAPAPAAVAPPARSPAVSPPPSSPPAEQHPEREGLVVPPTRSESIERDVPVEHPTSAPAPEPLAPSSLPEFPDGPEAFHLHAVTYDVERGVGLLTIVASQPVTYQVREFVYPDRLAIDLPGAVFLPRRQDLEVGSDAIQNIVVEQTQISPNLARIRINLRHKAIYATGAADGGRRLVLSFGDSRRATPHRPAVIIDPGHGGADSGAVGPSGVREADVTLAIGRMVQRALQRQGVLAVLTRTDDSTVSLEDRPDIAQRGGGVLFISIHTNASQSPGKVGTETYYKTPESQALATMIQGEVVQALGVPDRGIRTADFYVIIKTPMPAVLLETAFISNPGEERMLRDPAVQQRIADAIARAIVHFLETRTATPAP